MDAAARFWIATGAFVHERYDWDVAVAKAVAGGWRCLELSVMTEELLDSLVSFVRRDGHALDRFERVSIHAPVRVSRPVKAVAETLAAMGEGWDVVFHPDVYGSEPALRRLGRRVVFENMDIQKSFGRTASDLATVFAGHEEAGFCLDVAHVWTNDPTLGLADELLDSFGARLRQVHVSGIEPDGTHRTTTAADLDLYAPVLARCEHVPWLLEGEPAE